MNAKDTGLAFGARLTAEVLSPMKRAFVGKDEIIDLLGVCLVGGENLFLLGPPGTAKSALVHDLSSRLRGRTFDYLLTRFTEPSELFGPFDIRKLREGELVTNTEGMLPEASLVFLDELLNANSAILNSLLMALNERVFRRGRETRPLAALMFVGASNHTPEDDALKALYDRFLLRVHCDNVPEERLQEVLHAGWKLEAGGTEEASFGFDEVEVLQRLRPQVSLAPVHARYVELIHRIRQAGIPVSDRRAVKLQNAVAATAFSRRVIGWERAESPRRSFATSTRPSRFSKAAGRTPCRRSRASAAPSRSTRSTGSARGRLRSSTGSRTSRRRRTWWRISPSASRTRRLRTPTGRFVVAPRISRAGRSRRVSSRRPRRKSRGS